MVNDFPKDIVKASGAEDTRLHSPIPNTVFVLGRVSIALKRHNDHDNSYKGNI